MRRDCAIVYARLAEVSTHDRHYRADSACRCIRRHGRAIARLQGENVALKKELLGRKLPLPGTVRPAPTPAKPEPPRAAPREEAEGNGMLAMLGKVWRRLVDLIASWRRYVLG